MMIKPNMPNVPGMEAMTDSLDFVKNLWSSMGVPGMNMSGMSVPGMNIPGMVMPTLSVEEIHKKITDLKAVETWLTLNMNMLRGTIQGLEVQAATISTLQQMGETFTATMNPAAAAPQAPTSAYGGNGGSTGNGSQQAEHAHHAPEPSKKDEQDAASLTAPLVNAAAWWNVLQDQFQQAVSSAMTTEPPAAASSVKPKTKAKPKAKTVSATTTPARKRKPAK
jgi:hypothetical protein